MLDLSRRRPDVDRHEDSPRQPDPEHGRRHLGPAAQLHGDGVTPKNPESAETAGHHLCRLHELGGGHHRVDAANERFVRSGRMFQEKPGQTVDGQCSPQVITVGPAHREPPPSVGIA